MFVFNNRPAFCLYDKKAGSLRLFDADGNSSNEVQLESELLCAVIGCRDDQIFYARQPKSRQKLGHHRRPIQGMKIGDEVRVTELSGLEPRATFDIACRDEDSAQVLIIVSTKGKYQSHRLDLEERNVGT